MISGNSRKPRGFALLALILTLTGGAILGGLVLSRFSAAQTQQRREREEAMLARIREGFVSSVERQQAIPGPDQWIGFVASVMGVNQATVEWVRPEASNDSSGRRIFLVDPNLTPGVLPYMQTVAGVTGSSEALLGPNARIMIVSCSQPGLSLPFQSGTSEPAVFERLWNWVYTPATRDPPLGWPAEWSHNGNSLHVARISLASLFAEIKLKHARVGLGVGSLNAGAVPANLLSSGGNVGLLFHAAGIVEDVLQVAGNHAGTEILGETTASFLKGSLLAVAETNGTVRQLRIVRVGEFFDLSPPEVPVEEGGEEDSGGTWDWGWGWAWSWGWSRGRGWCFAWRMSWVYRWSHAWGGGKCSRCNRSLSPFLGYTSGWCLRCGWGAREGLRRTWGRRCR